MEERKDKYKNVFDAYLRLQTETYELVLRSVTMQNRLSEAYELVREPPEVSPEELYSRLKDKFEGIYEDAFSMFLRPFRVMMPPGGEYLRVHSGKYAPEYGWEVYMDLFRLWGEAQSNFLKGIVNAYQGYSRESQEEGSEKEGTVGQRRELGPANLLKNIADEETAAYFTTMGKYIEYFGESQFLLPKTFFVHLRNGVSSYSKMYRLWRKYESMHHDAWEKSAGKFVEGIVKNRTSPAEIEYKDFFEVFVQTYSEEYSGLLKSSEFIEAQNGVINALADIFYNFEKTIEAQLDMFPILPFALRGEIDAVEKRIYDQGKGARELERDMRGIKGRLKTTPTSEELVELRKRVEGMEKEIKRLSKKAQRKGE